jgi:hypothetical protein
MRYRLKLLLLYIQSSSLSVVTLIVRFTLKVINKWFCRVQCILVRLYSPKQELKDKHRRADSREYTHPRSHTQSFRWPAVLHVVGGTSPEMWHEMSFEPQIPYVKDKGKVNPRRSHEGPEREWKYSSTLSLTPALDWGGYSTLRPGSFTPGKVPVPVV